jgi:hypothetical protein
MQASRKIKSVDAKAASVNIDVFAIKMRSDNATAYATGSLKPLEAIA